MSKKERRWIYRMACVLEVIALNIYINTYCKHAFTLSLSHICIQKHIPIHTVKRSMWAVSPALWNILHPTCLYNSLSTSSSWSLITLSLYHPLGRKNTPFSLSVSLSSLSLIEISQTGALCNRAWFCYTLSIKGAHHSDEIRLQQIPSLVQILCC